MSKNKDDLAMQNFYGPFMNIGNKYVNDPTQNKQQRLERMYIRIFSELAMNRFKWEGLPTTVDPRFLEKVLFENALAVFYEDSDFGMLALRGSPSGEWNMYDNPVSFMVTGNTQVNKNVSASLDPDIAPGFEEYGAVPIWSNYARTPDLDIVLTYAEKLANIDRSIEINSSNLRQNKIIVASENRRLSYSNFNRQLEQGVGVIFTDMDMGEGVSALDIGADPEALRALMETRTRMWGDCMLLLGINNNPGQDKNERLVANEVSANDDQIMAQRSVSLNARQQACEVINRRYSLNISVRYVNDAENEAVDGEIEDDEEQSTLEPATKPKEIED